MDNYLKGKSKIHDSAEHLKSVKAMSDAKAGFPIQQGNKVEVTAKEGEPKIECITENGRISRIMITCKCGEQIELNCKYS